MKFISLLTKNLYSSKPWYLCLLKEVHSPIFFQLSVFSNFILLVAIYLRNTSYQNCSLSKKKQVQFSSVAQLCLTLCNPMNCSTSCLPVHHQLPEFTQTHVHRVGDAIQPSHPLLSPSPPAPNPSQHQSFPMSQLFTWGGQSTGVSALASFLPKKSQGWSLQNRLVGPPCSPRDSQEASPTPQFKSINSSALSFLHSPILTSTGPLEKP